MSGGSYDYAFIKLENFADELKVGDCPYRAAFKKQLLKVAKAAHDIEWVDSGDYGDGDEFASIIDLFESKTSLEIKAAAFDRIKAIIKEEK